MFKTLLFISSLFFMIAIYPMLISIYVTLPLFIGFAGFMIVKGLEGAKWRYIFLALLYLTNLEINLSLPLFMTLLASLIAYLVIYPHLNLIKQCQGCVAFIMVVSIDLIYFGLLVTYDFIFNTKSIGINLLLLYSLTMDAIVAVLL